MRQHGLKPLAMAELVGKSSVNQDKIQGEFMEPVRSAVSH